MHLTETEVLWWWLFILPKSKELLWNFRNQASEFLEGEELRSFWHP